MENLEIPRQVSVIPINQSKKYIQYTIIILILIFTLNNAIPFFFKKIKQNKIINAQLEKINKLLNFKDIVKHNKCNPLIMPFVRLINGGELSTSENFQQCVKSMFSSFFGEYIKMFSSNQNMLFSTIKTMLADIGNMKKVIDGVRQSLISTLSDIYARLQNTFKRVHQLFLNVKKVVSGIMDVFKDLFTTLKFVYFSLSSTWNGPIGGIARTFCFEKKTQIQMQTNKTRSICNVKIGDILKGGGTVTSIMKFRANGQTIYNYKNIIVSGNHPVFSEDIQKWKYIKDMDESYIVDFKDEFIYCLNTSNNIIYINNIKFSDYNECSDRILNKAIIEYTHYHLNQKYKSKNENVSIEPFGFYCEKQILNLDDENILGKIKTNSKNIKYLYKFNGIITTGSVFVFVNGEWKQMCECGEKVENNKDFVYNVITKDNLIKINDTYFRDFYVSFSKIYNKNIDKMVQDWMNILLKK
jgi:hypothetical protein